MFERGELFEIEKRLRKNQLYKEMLDNQILMNKHYKQSQLAKSKVYSNLSKGNQDRNNDDTFRSKKMAIVKKMKQRNLEDNEIFLPSIAAESRYYKGHSRYRSIDQSQAKNYATNIVHTEADHQNSSESEVEEIIKQMKTINEKISQNNRKKKRRLVINRQLRQNINSKRQGLISTLDLHQVNNPEYNYGRFKSKSVGLRNNIIDNNLNQKLLKLQGSSTYDLSPQNYRMNSFINHSKQDQIIQKNDQMKRQRQKFMKILKKVNKRGKNLLLRVSNFPSPKTQFIDPDND